MVSSMRCVTVSWDAGDLRFATVVHRGPPEGPECCGEFYVVVYGPPVRSILSHGDETPGIEGEWDLDLP